MFGLKYFELFHEGYWKTEPVPPPPTWFLIMPKQRDSDEIARWKISEMGLSWRRQDDFDRFCRGIPFENYRPLEYTKGEIGNFLNAIAIGSHAYDYNSIEVLRPHHNYPVVDQYLAKVRRSVSLRTELQSWLR